MKPAKSLIPTINGLKCKRYVNLAVVCIHGLVSCLGILENALIIWVVGFRLKRRTVASVWVLNLAMSDFLATLTLPLFTSYLNSPHSWELGNPLCKAQASIFFLNMFVSAFLLAAISLDRLLLATKPVWSQNHRSVAGAWKVCAVGWLWAAMNTLPYFLFRSVTEKRDGRKLCYHNFALYLSSGATLERDCNVRQGTTAISKLVLAFLLPLVVVVGSYVKIGISLRNRDRRRKQSSCRLNDTLIVFTKMVTSVIAAFALCWAPYHIFCMIEIIAHHKEESLKLVEVGLPLATTFAFLNPLLNPILYAFSCPHFCVRIRQSLGAVFDGLVEEGGGLLMAPGRSLRAHMRRKSSKDVSFTTPGSPKSPHFQNDNYRWPPGHLSIGQSYQSHGLSGQETAGRFLARGARVAPRSRPP
uniref:Prostaglandin D2 receptor 2 n=1 Tax=Acanthochromis polyacanthus TaxID=80966 RepID=A0A3Q1G1X4_9TELE